MALLFLSVFFSSYDLKILHRHVRVGEIHDNTPDKVSPIYLLDFPHNNRDDERFQRFPALLIFSPSAGFRILFRSFFWFLEH